MNANKLPILQQKYVVACELRTLAALQYGRDSDQFRKSDAKAVKAAGKLGPELFKPPTRGTNK